MLNNPRIEDFIMTYKNKEIFGFKLIGNKNEFCFCCSSKEERDTWIKVLRKVCISKDIIQHYAFYHLIGKGSFAEVRLAKLIKDGTYYAIKSIDKDKIYESKRNITCLMQEIKILRLLNHPNIIKLYEVYEDDSYIHLVLEYLKGGELYKMLQKKDLYSEKDASIIIKGILQALQHCHSLNIVHRDLKPENLILV